MNTLTSTRRNVMRALAAMTTGLPTLAYATPALVCMPMPDTTAWDAALSRYDAIKEEAERFWRGTEERAQEILDRYAPHPWLPFTHTAQNGDTAIHQVDPDNFDRWSMHPWAAPEIERIKAEWERYERVNPRLKRMLRWDRIVERSNAYGAAVADAAATLVAMPSPHFAAVSWKIDYLFGPDACGDATPSYGVEYVQPLFDDIRRLGGVA